MLQYLIELAKLNESKLKKDGTQTTKLKNGKDVLWPWKVECGLCNGLTMLRYDADLKGRVNAFQRRKYSFILWWLNILSYKDMVY